MLTERQGERLPEWLDAVRRDDLPSLHALSAGIDRDRDAVIAGLTLPWSSGVVEGHVNRIRMLKRQMFGRAGFALLRKRVLLSSCQPLSAVAAMITARQREEIIMGTWDIGPFENDMAADFAYTLDETAQDKREGLVRATLSRTIQPQDYLESPEGAEAVAAAALIAAQCPGGEPISTSYGPEEALPTDPHRRSSAACCRGTRPSGRREVRARRTLG